MLSLIGANQTELMPGAALLKNTPGPSQDTDANL